MCEIKNKGLYIPLIKEAKKKEEPKTTKIKIKK
jgi:hypothetical protein